MTADHVIFEKQGAVGIITLNRPEARNALTPEMFDALGEAVKSCTSPEIRSVLFTGAGGAFCSGLDVRWLADKLEERGPEGVSQIVRELADLLHKNVVLPLRRLQKPVVAGIKGVAAGGGFSLTLACDLRIASRDSRFFMAYANIGATADGGSTYLLPRLVGVGRAMDIYLASQPMSAEYALEMGLINRVCEPDELEKHALETALRLAEGPTVAYGRAKELFEQSWSSTLEEQLDAETETFAKTALSSDFQEGIKAFAERRQAWFQGK